MITKIKNTLFPKKSKWIDVGMYDRTLQTYPNEIQT